MKHGYAYVRVLTVALVIAKPAFAQSEPFLGASLGYNWNQNSVSTEMNADTTTRVNGIGWTSLGGSLQTAYGWGMGSTGLFTIGATYSMTDISAGDFTSSGDSFLLKKRDVYSIYVEPGFRLGGRTLAYAKLAYEGANLRAEGKTGDTNLTLKGTGYGFGMRSQLENTQVYLQAEIKQIFYLPVNFPGRSGDVNSSATTGSVGIGYQFK